MVIAKGKRAGKLPAGRRQIRKKTRWPGNACDGEHTGSRADGGRVTAGYRTGTAQRPPHAEHGRDAKRPADAFGSRFVAGGDEHRICRGCIGERFAQATCGKRAIGDIVLVDEQQIHGPLQLQMLKAVVEHVHGGAEPPFGDETCGVADTARASISGSSPARATSASTARPSETTVTPSLPSRRAYPRVRIDGRSPCSSSSRAMQATIGVLPAPPTDGFPTLITGRASTRRRRGSRAYHCRRHDAARP